MLSLFIRAEHPLSPLHKGENFFGGRKNTRWQDSCHPLHIDAQYIILR